MPRPGCFVLCLVEIDSVVLEKIYFMLLDYYLPLEMDIKHYVIYSNPFDLRMCCAKFDWICKVDQEFSSCLVYIFTVHCYLALEKVLALHLKKLKSSSTKDDLCQVWPLGTKNPSKMVKVFSVEGAKSSSMGRWLQKQLYAKILQNLLENQGANLNQTWHKAV